MGKKTTKKRKVELVFDDQKRREYLSGFRKRKQERRKKAKEELEIQVKEERKRIKLEVKEGLRDKLKQSFAPIPELENELNEEEYETEDVSVKIVELSTSDLAKSNNWIGENRPKYNEEESRKSDEESDIDDATEKEEIPGMGLTEVKSKNKRIFKVKTENTENTKPADNKNKYKSTDPAKLFKSKKDISRTVQKDELRTLKNSKAFQMKRRLDQLKDRKKARIEREKRIKIQNKEAKKNGGRVNNRKLKKKLKAKGRK